MAVSAEVCRKCRRMYIYPGFGSHYCPDCRKVDEANKEKVKEYLREHGTANMVEISENTGVSKRDINQYLRDGMLEIPDGSPIYIKCERCGCDIRSGRWCPECAATLSKELKGMFVGVGEKPKVKLEGKMRFLRKKI